MADQDSVLPGASANLDAATTVVGDATIDVSATNADEALGTQPLEATSINSVSATSLEPDTGGDDENDGASTNLDSAISSWRSNRTQSLTSSVANFKFENGRRYHAFREGSYNLPNDEHEQERLDMQHLIYRLALDNKLFLAPVPTEKLLDVLDVGCGTGLWAIDVADENPQAQVLGIDLSPIQPDLVPPNCRFLVDDCNSDWVFGQTFDLIHTRAMTPSIRDWPRYLQQAYDNLKPGGYIELHEVNVPAACTAETANPKPLFLEWSELLLEAGTKIGLDLTAPKKLRGWLHDAGFTDVHVKWQNWPVGAWAKGARNKEIGKWWAEDMKDVTRNTGAMFTRVLGWQPEEVEVFAANIANEISAGTKHAWVEMCFVYGQKPATVG